MPADLRWSDSALADLGAIFDFVSTENPRAADALIETIGGACEKLRRFPDIGRAYDDRYRLLVIGTTSYSMFTIAEALL